MIKGQGGIFETPINNTGNVNSMDFLSQFFNKSSTISNQNQSTIQNSTSQNNQKPSINSINSNNIIDFS